MEQLWRVPHANLACVNSAGRPEGDRRSVGMRDADGRLVMCCGSDLSGVS